MGPQDTRRGVSTYVSLFVLHTSLSESLLLILMNRALEVTGAMVVCRPSVEIYMR